MLKRLTIKFFFLLILFSFVFIPVVYYFIDFQVSNADINLASRKIETPPKLWLNGYLALFTNFNFHSNFNWMSIPLFVYFIYLKHKLKIKWNNLEIFFLIFIFLSVLLISVKGFFNFRYSYTLVPFIIIIILLLNYNICVLSENKKWLFVLPTFLIFISFINFVKQVSTSRFQKHLYNILGIKINNSIHQSSFRLNTFNTDNAFKVNNVIYFIQYLNTNHYFLVNNLPDFYYYLNDKKGHYYWSGDDDWLSKEGYKRIFNSKTNDEVKKFLINNLNCRYIYTHITYFDYNSKFDDFLLKECQLVAYDNEGRLLYEIKN